jgi:hypothetical protein
MSAFDFPFCGLDVEGESIELTATERAGGGGAKEGKKGDVTKG